MKNCVCCGTPKELIEFRHDKSRKDGFHPYCKSCQKTLRQKAYNENPLVKEGDKRRHQKYYHESIGRDTLKAYGESVVGQEVALKSRKQWYLSGHGAQYHKNQYHNNILFKLRHNLSARTRSVLLQSIVVKDASILEFLGCTLDQLRLQFESQFTEGMTWENYGKWHIDHKKPCAAFDLVDLDQQKLCFHHSNLQPLWAKDNLEKNSYYKGIKHSFITNNK